MSTTRILLKALWSVRTKVVSGVVGEFNS